ncbi:hypothetical protein LR48_Vigan07g159000 [Vigna angularis]|uniref:Ubiquitin-like protease family profile domain-containing protein n=1 Tax=Phaseolus angularis TaxID=3914 RepID=A0A0L9UYV6_PHAAN|nr:hypothetical protein LR48_Vigan07g159000 [Vigna angularis]
MPYFGPPAVYRPEKQPIAQPVNEACEEAEDHDAISILTSRLNKLRKGPIELLWELRTFGLECHVPFYINFDDAYEIIGGEKMLSISCIQLCAWPLATHGDHSKKEQVVWFCFLHRKIKAELKSLIQTVVIRTRGQQLEIIYPKCNKQNDSWACGYYIMSWMKAITRAEIRGEWTELEATTGEEKVTAVTGLILEVRRRVDWLLGGSTMVDVQQHIQSFSPWQQRTHRAATTKRKTYSLVQQKHFSVTAQGEEFTWAANLIFSTDSRSHPVAKKRRCSTVWSNTCSSFTCCYSWEKDVQTDARKKELEWVRVEAATAALEALPISFEEAPRGVHGLHKPSKKCKNLPVGLEIKSGVLERTACLEIHENEAGGSSVPAAATLDENKWRVADEGKEKSCCHQVLSRSLAGRKGVSARR